MMSEHSIAYRARVRNLRRLDNVTPTEFHVCESATDLRELERDAEPAE